MIQNCNAHQGLTGLGVEGECRPVWWAWLVIGLVVLFLLGGSDYNDSYMCMTMMMPMMMMMTMMKRMPMMTSLVQVPVLDCFVCYMYYRSAFNKLINSGSCAAASAAAARQSSTASAAAAGGQ